MRDSLALVPLGSSGVVHAISTPFQTDAAREIATTTNPLAYSEIGSSTAAPLTGYTGRYTQPDPIGVGGRGDSGIEGFLSDDPTGFMNVDLTNPYRYVLNNPLRFYDTTGLFTIDSSCDCRPGGPPPGASAGWGSELIQEATLACRRLHEITDPKLRRCMEKTCDSGVIECLDNCPSGKAGHTDFTFYGLKVRTSGICTNNWTQLRPHLADTILHEFAHGCLWGHGGGKGVPGGTGVGFP